MNAPGGIRWDGQAAFLLENARQDLRRARVALERLQWAEAHPDEELATERRLFWLSTYAAWLAFALDERDTARALRREAREARSCPR